MTDEELSHCVLSTIEYYEYKVLLELLGDKVRHIIPPTEKEDTFNMGLVRGADALSEEYINNEIIKHYVEDPNVTIILYENPPYADTRSVEHQKRKQTSSASKWKQSYLMQQMKQEVKGMGVNEMGNIFIWSGFKYYLRRPTDSYIIYSPIKYWKEIHLVNKKFERGFAFNRKHFHTKIDALVSCILWSNSEEKLDTISLEAYNIIDNKIFQEEDLTVNRIYTKYSNVFYDKRKFTDDRYSDFVLGLNGAELTGNNKITSKTIINDNLIGYLRASGVNFDNPDLASSLLVASLYNGAGYFPLRKDNYLQKLPMFAASRYITYNRHWTQRANIMKSADGAEKFNKACATNKIEQELLKILLFTTLETQNHMRSLRGSDGRFYRNELSLDRSNGDTLATKALKSLKKSQKEEELFSQWEKVLVEAKKTDEYDISLTYSVYQIIDELNLSIKDENDKIVYFYPELNGHLNTLKTMVKEYYNSEIVPFLFEYDFLK